MSGKRRKPDSQARRTGLKLAAVAAGMFVFGYALVPLYDVICEVTGLNGKPGRAEAKVADQPDMSRWVTVEFTGQSMSGLPWEFRPAQKSIRVRPGVLSEAVYEVRNTASEAITGQAVPSVAPSKAASQLKKIECFCFTQQTLAAGESRRMPVKFVVDPSLSRDISTVTLSYAFFNASQVSARKYGGDRAEAPQASESQHQHHAEPAKAGG